jgi:RNA polymerase sigma-70 factor, ECF subfamily
MTDEDSARDWAPAGQSRSEREPATPADEQLVIGLFDELRGGLMRYLLGLGVRSQDGEELIQEVFLALFEHLRRGRSRQNLRGWLFRVAHNLGLKRRMANAREKAMELEAERAESRLDSADDPEKQLLNAQRHQRLQAIMQALPEQDQWCLSLRAEGLRYREIADVLDMSLGSVSASLARSLARLSRADE